MEEEPTVTNTAVSEKRIENVAMDETPLVKASVDEISVDEQSVKSKISNGSSSGQQLSDWSTTVYTEEQFVEGLIKTWEVIIPSVERKDRDGGDWVIPDENEKTPLTRSTLLHHWSEREARSPEERLAIKMGFWTDRGFLESYSDDSSLEPFAETVVDDKGDDFWTESQAILMEEVSSPVTENKAMSEHTSLSRQAVNLVIEETAALKPKADADKTTMVHNSVDAVASKRLPKETPKDLEEKKDKENFLDSVTFAAGNATINLGTVATVAESIEVQVLPHDDSFAKSDGNEPSAIKQLAPEIVSKDTIECVIDEGDPPAIEELAPEIISEDATECVTDEGDPPATEKLSPETISEDATECVIDEGDPPAIEKSVPETSSEDATECVTDVDDPPAIEESDPETISEDTTECVTDEGDPPAIKQLAPEIISDDATECVTDVDDPPAIEESVPETISEDATECVIDEGDPPAIEKSVPETSSEDTTECVTDEGDPPAIKQLAPEIISDDATECVTDEGDPSAIEKSVPETISEDATECVIDEGDPPAIEKSVPETSSEDTTECITDENCSEPTSDLLSDDLRAYLDDVAMVAERKLQESLSDNSVEEEAKVYFKGAHEPSSDLTADAAEYPVKLELVAEVNGFEQTPDLISEPFSYVEEPTVEIHSELMTDSASEYYLQKVVVAEDEVDEGFPETVDAYPSKALPADQGSATSEAVDRLQEPNPWEGVTVQTFPEPMNDEASEHLLEAVSFVENDVDNAIPEIIADDNLKSSTLDQSSAINEIGRMSIAEVPPKVEELDPLQNEQDFEEVTPAIVARSPSRDLELGNDDSQSRTNKIPTALASTLLWSRHKFLGVLFVLVVALVGGAVGAIIVTSGSGGRERGAAVKVIPPIETNRTSSPSGVARTTFTPSTSSPNSLPSANLTLMPSKSSQSSQPPLVHSVIPTFPPSSFPTIRGTDTLVPTTTTPIVQFPTIFPSPSPSFTGATASPTANFLWSVALQGGAEFVDPNSYQSLAFNWVMNTTDIGTSNNTQIVQRYALACFYFSTFFDWTDSTRWLSNETECNWVGVVCDDSGVLTGFSLEQNNLLGVLPAELSLLTNAYAMWFSMNTGLFGTLPTEIGSLTLLESFNLYGCGLSGTIPKEFGNMTNIKNLWLSDNLLTGTIPTTLGNLANLSVLEVQGNALTGEMPSEVCALDNFASELHYIQADCQEITCSCCEFCS